MQIKLSRKQIADAILHNNNVSSGNWGTDKLGVFVNPNGSTEIHGIDRGTDYGREKIYDPESFVVAGGDDDTYQYRHEARDELIKEGKIRDVLFNETTEEEDELITDLVDEWIGIWEENLSFPPHIICVDDAGNEETIEIEWID
jgi:hypothetical protein